MRRIPHFSNVTYFLFFVLLIFFLSKCEVVEVLRAASHDAQTKPGLGLNVSATLVWCVWQSVIQDNRFQVQHAKGTTEGGTSSSPPPPPATNASCFPRCACTDEPCTLDHKRLSDSSTARANKTKELRCLHREMQRRWIGTRRSNRTNNWLLGE